MRAERQPRRRSASCAVLLGSAFLAPLPLAAQGVPVFDAAGFLRTGAIIAQRDRDLTLQSEKRSREAELAQLREAQLAALEGISGALQRSPTAHENPGPSALRALEDGTPLGSSAAALYAAEDPNPAAARLFGDAKADIEALIIRAAEETHGLPGVSAAGLSPLQWRCLLQALVWQESRFQIGARSPVGAYGLTQIMPATAGDLGILPDYYDDPYLQLTGGARYLAQMLAMFDGNLIHALAAYNAGPGNVRSHGGVPPFTETQNYVLSVPAQYNRYLAEIGGPEARGSIDPVLLANAGLSLSAHSTGSYGDYAMVSVTTVAGRLKEIIRRIPETRDAQDALALNSYARAELARILAIRARIKAARLAPEGAEQLRLSAEQAADRPYMIWEGQALQ